MKRILLNRGPSICLIQKSKSLDNIHVSAITTGKHNAHITALHREATEHSSADPLETYPLLHRLKDNKISILKYMGT